MKHRVFSLDILVKKFKRRSSFESLQLSCQPSRVPVSLISWKLQLVINNKWQAFACCFGRGTCEWLLPCRARES